MSDSSSPVPSDFPDRISPMIVKEVRQGLRSRAFIGSFLLLHGVLVMWSAGFLSDTSAGANEGIDGIFWSILSLGLLIIAMRAQTAVRAERDGKTLELLQLTRISAWSIVSGKWCALMIEALVLVAGILPYFMLRYYFGTLHVARDSFLVLLMLVGCGLVAAFMTMVSSLGKMVGGLARVGSFILGFMLFWGVAAAAFNSRRGTFDLDKPGILALILALSLPYCMIFLGVAASSVAASSENIATRQRLWGFALFVPAAIAGIAYDKEVAGGLLVAAIPGVILVSLECVLRRSSTSMPLYSRHVAESRWRRALCFLVAPSHGAGVLCLVLLWLIVSAVVVSADRSSTSEHTLARTAVLLSVLNVMLLPAALGMLLRRVLRLAFAPRYWIAFALLTFPVAILGTLTLGNFAIPARMLIGLFPVGILSLVGRSDSAVVVLLGVAILHLLAVLAVLVPFVVKDLRAVRRMMRGERTEMPAA